MSFKYKQVIAVRTDLKMSKGKTAVQVAHGSLSSYVKTKKYYPDWADNWFKEGQKKITVKVKTEEEILEIAELARRNDIPYSIINDAGLTQLPPGTITVVGIGPAREELVDKVSSDLPLL
jgi:PTH2 family peptidyl-tRNA hydrolase